MVPKMAKTQTMFLVENPSINYHITCRYSWI